MTTVEFSIPQMDNVPSSAPELYLWFAYFWADIHTLSSSQKASIFVPPLSDPRAISQNTTGRIAIPDQIGTFQTDLDDGGAGLGGASVVIALFEKHDTPDDAISAGYAAFGPAILQQIDTFLEANGLVRPTDKQINDMVNGVADAVTSAVSSHLSIWDKIFGTQDKNVGYSSVLVFGPDQLQVGEGGGRTEHHA